MLATPATSHVSFDNIYEPAEDSFLLLDALSSASERAFLNDRFRLNTECPLVLEVGTGSGVVLAFVAANANAIFGRSDVLALGVDINQFACHATVETVHRDVDVGSKSGVESVTRPGIFLDCVNGDLASCVRSHAVEVLICNPPYVPSDCAPAVNLQLSNEYTSSRDAIFKQNLNMLALATDGGEDGMEVTNKLLDQLPSVLNKDHGVAYVLLCAQNKPEAIKRRIRAWGVEWYVETVRHSGKQGGWERLQVIRISRQSGNLVDRFSTSDM